jgi:hypothetical protein
MASSSRVWRKHYSGARDFAMSTDDIAICGIAIAKPNPDRLKDFQFQAVNLNLPGAGLPKSSMARWRTRFRSATK